MGNSTSAQASNNINSNSHSNVLRDSVDFAVDTMVADVEITSIKQHLKAGKPSKEFMFLENEDVVEVDETIEAQKLYNREKNRYTNILPCDSTRVKLSAVAGVEGSDYINANFIDGELNGTERAYIATQGPLMHTRCDFWRMVWENGCATIVMLGKERENDRVKVDRYWPEPGPDGALTFGPLVVRAVGKEDDVGRGITVRRLELLHTPSGDVRSVTHYQYEGWPDHGVPTSAAPIRHLIRLIEKERGYLSYTYNTSKEEGSNGNIIGHSGDGDLSNGSSNTQSPSPVVVHCSAGVGRTGTFCTIHMTLLRLHREMQKGAIARFNLYNTVLKLRRQRPGMVQQQEQYVFCYEAVAEEAEELGLLPCDSVASTPTHTPPRSLASSVSSIDGQ